MSQKIIPTVIQEGKYINFCLVELKPKTKVIDVVTQEDDLVIGTIKWYPQWRKYSLFPAENTIFETVCLKEITDFIMNLNIEHRRNTKERKCST